MAVLIAATLFTYFASSFVRQRKSVGFVVWVVTYHLDSSIILWVVLPDLHRACPKPKNSRYEANSETAKHWFEQMRQLRVARSLRLFEIDLVAGPF
jgi:Na+/melibiose symporter-like transporter